MWFKDTEYKRTWPWFGSALYLFSVGARLRRLRGRRTAKNYVPTTMLLCTVRSFFLVYVTASIHAAFRPTENYINGALRFYTGAI